MSGHPKNAGYRPGDGWEPCFKCGLEYRWSEFRKEYDSGAYVCRSCFDSRHPQDLVRGTADKIAPPRPIHTPTDEYVSVTYEDATSTIPDGTFDNSLD